MAEYGSMFIVAALARTYPSAAILRPIPIAQPIAETTARVLGVLPFANEAWIAEYLTNLLGCLNLVIKSCLGVTLMIWIRWTLPRLRIDQVITMCWKYCVPLSAVGFVGLLFWQTFQLPFINDIAPNHRIAVREHWATPAIPHTEDSATEDANALKEKSEEPMPPIQSASSQVETGQVSGIRGDKTRGGA